MNKLIHLALKFSREVHTLKIFAETACKNRSKHIADEWFDGEQVMSVLNISRRTLQSLRDKDVLPFSQVKGKFYYKTSDIETILETKYVKKRKTRIRTN